MIIYHRKNGTYIEFPNGISYVGPGEDGKGTVYVKDADDRIVAQITKEPGDVLETRWDTTQQS
jgi:hypothetical protein